MIKYNDRFSFKSHTHGGWMLQETTEGKDRDGNPKDKLKETFHGNLRQIADAIIEKSAEDCQSMREIKELLSDAKEAALLNVESKKR